MCLPDDSAIIWTNRKIIAPQSRAGDMTDDPGVERWKNHQSAFDRVRGVAVTLSRPRSAVWIAEQAHVAENTARTHLKRLVEMNVLRETQGEDAVTYRLDPLYRRMCTLRELLDGRDRDDLLDLRADLQEQIETWQTEYGADSAEALREQAATTETAALTRKLRRTANDWDVVRYRLRLVEEAIERYPEYTDAGTASA